MISLAGRLIYGPGLKDQQKAGGFLHRFDTILLWSIYY